MRTNHAVRTAFPATKGEHYKAIVEEYRDSGGQWPTDMRTIAKWAIDTGRYEPHSDPASDLAQHLARTLRHELITDDQGRRVRQYHAIPGPLEDDELTQADGGPPAKGQRFLWKEMSDASPKEMHLALGLRRIQAKGECRQIKTDQDSFNENYNKSGRPIKMSFNFDRDFEDDAMPDTYDPGDDSDAN